MRLAGGVVEDGRPRGQRGRHQDVLGRHHRRLVHEDVAGAQTALRAQHVEAALELAGGAECAEAVEVGVKAPAADRVAAGRRHLGAPEAREQRAGEQERGADLLAERGIDGVGVDVGAAEAQLVLAVPAHAHAEALEDLEHRVDVADPRDVAERELGVGQHRCREDRKRAVLVAGGFDSAAERRAALNDELLHRWCQRASLHRRCGDPGRSVEGAAVVHEQPPARGVIPSSRSSRSPRSSARGRIAAASIAAHSRALIRTCVLQSTLQTEPRVQSLFRAKHTRFAGLRRGPRGVSIRRRAHHTNKCSGAPHILWSHPAPSTARSTSPVPPCSSSFPSRTPTGSSTRARTTRIVRLGGNGAARAGPERCWHVRSTASHRWSDRRPAAGSSQAVADAGRQPAADRAAPGLERESRRSGAWR